jgi:hypothetical protein
MGGFSGGGFGVLVAEVCSVLEDVASQTVDRGCFGAFVLDRVRKVGADHPEEFGDVSGENQRGRVVRVFPQFVAECVACVFGPFDIEVRENVLIEQLVDDRK